MAELDTKSGIAIGALIALVFGILSQVSFAKQEQVIISNQGQEGIADANSNIPCSFLIFKDNMGNTDSKDCSTGKVVFTNVDSSTTIQNALNSISTKGGEIFIKANEYFITKPINFTGSSETIRGEGVATNGGTWLNMQNNCNCNMFQYANSSKPTILFPVITELYMQGQSAHNTKGNGTFFGGSNSIQLVKDFEMTQVYMDGFAQFGIVSNNAHDYKLQHNAIEHMGNYGIFIKTGDSIRIQDTLFRQAGAIQIGCDTKGGFNVDLNCGNKFAKGAVINNNKIEAGNITIENSAVVIEGNIFDQLPSGYNTINMKFNDTGSIISSNIMNGSAVGNYGILIDNSTSSQVGIFNNQFMKYVQASIISDVGTNTNIRNNIPTSVNNDLVAGSGITITKGLLSNTIASNNANWQQLCQTILGSANATISCDNFTATKNLIIQIYSISNGGTGISIAIRFNGDSATNYAYRTSNNGGVDGSAVSQAQCAFDGTLVSGDTPYTTLYIDNNIASNRKIGWYEQVMGADTNSATAVTRADGACKWSNTSSQITSITILSNAGTGNFNTNSEVTVWGYN